MKEIAIYGAGGLGRELLLLLHHINEEKPQWNILGFFDDHQPKGADIQGFPVLDSFAGLDIWKKDLALVIAISDPNKKHLIAHAITNERIHFPRLIHPSVKIDGNNFCTIGEGTVIAAQTVLTVNIEIGRHVMINLDCTIGHDVKIADYCSIMPGANISGNVNVQEEVYVGTGAQIIQNITIGTKTTIGAGAVVIDHTSGGQTVAGVPARPV